MRGLVCVTSLAVAGAAAGWVAASAGMFVHREPIPVPYVVPRQSGGLSLSLAMVHDVLHERYVRPGPAYYAERNRRILAALPPSGRESGDDALPLLADLNDLAMGQFHVGQTAEALATLDRKQSLQGEVDETWRRDMRTLPADGRASWVAGQPDRLELYRTYANRGTILILDALTAGLHENPAAQEELDRGTELIREAIAMNADSHFGREPWQLAILEFLQAVCDRPGLLLEFDMVGNRLDATIDAGASPQVAGWPERWLSLPHHEELLPRLLAPDPDAATQSLRKEIREQWITRVGAEEGWTDNVPTDHQRPAPFDEPALAIVGMWMIGGGPNPHFALALGGIMERVGERELAWQAYRRAESMAAHVWPDPEIQGGFAAHCRRRRQELENALTADRRDGAETSVADRLEKQFQDELAAGQEYQQAYRDFEAAQMAAGSPPDGERLYASFQRERGAIASDSKEFDRPLTDSGPLRAIHRLPAMVFFAGLFVLPAGMLRFRRQRRRPSEPAVGAKALHAQEGPDERS